MSTSSCTSVFDVCYTHTHTIDVLRLRGTKDTKKKLQSVHPIGYNMFFVVHIVGCGQNSESFTDPGGGPLPEKTNQSLLTVPWHGNLYIWWGLGKKKTINFRKNQSPTRLLFKVRQIPPWGGRGVQLALSPASETRSFLCGELGVEGPASQLFGGTEDP